MRSDGQAKSSQGGGSEILEPEVVDTTIDIEFTSEGDTEESVVIDITESVVSSGTGEPSRGEAPRTEGRARGPLHGRVAVVTGGSSGVGRSIALSLVAAGARVCVIGRDVARLRETVELAGRHAPILYLQCDVGSIGEIEGVVDFIERFDRPVDVLVHAAGVQVRGGIESGAVADLDEQYLVNLRGPYLLTQRLLPQLRSGRGHVVFLNADAATRSDLQFGQFTVSKQGLAALATLLRDEVAGSGVRVTSIAAGQITTAEADTGLLAEHVSEAVMFAVKAPRRLEISDLSLSGLPGSGAESNSLG